MHSTPVLCSKLDIVCCDVTEMQGFADYQRKEGNTSRPRSNKQNGALLIRTDIFAFGHYKPR